MLFLLSFAEYFTERDDYEDDDDEDEYDYELDESDGLCSSSVEESGLGLLARFAASAIPSPIITNPISIVQLEAKQKAKKKEERLLGKKATLLSASASATYFSSSACICNVSNVTSAVFPSPSGLEFPGDEVTHCYWLSFVVFRRVYVCPCVRGN